MKPKDHVMAQIHTMQEIVKINGAQIQVLTALQQVHKRRNADLQLTVNRANATIAQLRSLNRQQTPRTLWR